MRRLSLWAVIVAAGCNGRLTIHEGNRGGAGGTDGTSGGRAGGGDAGDVSDAGDAGDAVKGGVNGGQGGMGATAGMGANTNAAGHAPNQTGGTGGVNNPVGSAGNPFGYAGDPFSYGGEIGLAGSFNQPAPGALGQACIPGALVTEADGSPAKTVIRTLDRCDPGLSCDAQSKCVPTPDCAASSGLCVLRHAALGEYMPERNNGGHAGGVSYGGGGSLPGAGLKIGVVALSASESHVYWVEYGTRDALGNYQGNGALMSYSIADGTTATLAAGLAGPISLELTTSHVYVYVDGAPLLGSTIIPKLLRVPLTGGSPELVQDRAQPDSFAAAGSRAFWYSGETIYSITSDSNALPTVFLAQIGYGHPMVSDGTDLYIVTFGGALMRASLTSGAPVAVGVSLPQYDFALSGDGIFTLETLGTSYAGGLLSRAPKSGGPLVRVRALGPGDPSSLRVVGDRYFLAVNPGGAQGSNGQYTFKRQVLSASLVGSNPPIRLLERSYRGENVDRLWVGTAAALYWSDGKAIFKQPLPAP